MELKIVNALPAYIPDPTPLILEDVPRYLDVELVRISELMRPLLDTFSPPIAASMLNPQAPLTITLPHQPLTNYEIAYTGYADQYANVSIDPIAGTVTFGGAGDVNLLVKITANLILELGTYGFNETLSLFVSIDGIRKPLDISFIASNKEDFVSLHGSTLLFIPSDSVMFLEINGSASGTVSYVSGDFEVQYIDNDENPRL